MAKLIRRRSIVPDNWQLLDQVSATLPADATNVIVPLAHWIAQRDRLRTRIATIGVALEPGDDPAVLRDDIDALPLIAVRFASFADGRPFSIARLLRQRLGFAGELRAIGHVQRDQLAFMERCGFDAFVLSDELDAHAALIAFYELSESYQSALVSHVPVQPLADARTP